MSEQPKAKADDKPQDVDPSVETLGKDTESARRQAAPVPDDADTRGMLTRVETTPGLTPDVIDRANAAAQEAYDKVVAEAFKAAPDDTLYEVMVDTWGFSPEYTKGTLLRKADCPYDVDQAERMGTIRRAPEYENTLTPHTTMPLAHGTAGSKVDVEAQQSARGATGTAAETSVRSAAERASGTADAKK